MSIVEAVKVLDKIRQRGYWSVVIRPTKFDDSHIAYTDLFSIIEGNSVRLRGWDYPHVDHQAKQEGPDWIGMEYDVNHHLEIWRFHTNGLFVHYFAISTDWRDQSQFWSADACWKPNKEILYLSTIYSFLEIFEFAARLALSQAGGPDMRVEIAIKNLQGRQLVFSDRVVSFNEYLINSAEWKDHWDLSQTDLIARPRELAASAAQEFFARFGLSLSLDALRDLQGTIRRQ